MFCVLICISHVTFGQGSGWSVNLDGLGSFSSARVADLNADGVSDIILGAGRKEFLATDSAVIALDGRTGSMLWHVGARDQIFGSALIHDFNGDGTADVVINGRSAELKLIDGKTGRRIWQFLEGYSIEQARSKGWFNFYNPQRIPDQNGDGVDDLIVSNGGDVNAKPHDPDRPPGKLVVINGINGQVIAKADTPDGYETYMSVVTHDFGTGLEVIYGTGGETLPGNLYRVHLEDVLKGALFKSTMLASSTTNGFIAPVSLADVSGDGTHDIVSMAVEGRMIAIDGKTSKTLWEVKIPRTEAYVSPAVGQFVGDSTPDFFTTVNTGVWPNQEHAKVIIVDGGKGTLTFQRNVGFYQISSPVAFDLNADGKDEVLLQTNITRDDPSSDLLAFGHMLVLFDPESGPEQFSAIVSGSNPAPTPWVGDLDGDGKFDIIYSYQRDMHNVSIFSGFTVVRYDTDFLMRSKVSWGSYMGSNYDGKYVR